jgi:prophage antirepressor-like protein
MSNIVEFAFENKEVRITDRNGKNWFVLRDVLSAMNSKTKRQEAVESVEDSLGKGEVDTLPISDSLGRMQEALIISEPAVTYLLARSNTEEGKRLNKWIHTEVLPSIRKTGQYKSTTNITEIPKQEFDALLYVAKLIGLDHNASVISANNATKKITGINFLELLDQTHLIAENQKDLIFTPTELGKQISISGQQFNLLLAAAGLQTKNDKQWVPTEKAKDLYRILDTGKKHLNGTLVQQIKWNNSVVEIIKPFMVES